MRDIARRHTYFGLVLLLIGMCLGIYMGITGNHAYGGVHAHINLVGMVLSLLYASVFRLWVPDGPPTMLARAQLGTHRVGTVFFTVCLFFMLSGKAWPLVLVPGLLIGAALLLSAAVMMLVIFHRTT